MLQLQMIKSLILVTKLNKNIHEHALLTQA